MKTEDFTSVPVRMTNPPPQLMPIFEELEPRILLSGTQLPDNGESQAVGVDLEEVESMQTGELVSEVLFIDTGVENYSEMISKLDHNVEVYLIGPAEGGVEKITDILSDHENLTAIHIISHGDSGEISLGNEKLSSENISSYQTQLKAWGHSLSENADILIYGCDVGLQEQFVSDISSLTGADVAASDDLTGADWLDGDADLEVNVGTVEADALVSQETFNKVGTVLTADEFHSDPDVSMQLNSEYIFSVADFGSPSTNVTITSLPVDGDLTLSGGAVSVDQTIALADISNLIFTPDSDFVGSESISFYIDGVIGEPEALKINIIELTPVSIYWSDAGNDVIGNAALDNPIILTAVDLDTVLGSGSEVEALALDGFNDYMYWADPNTNTIQRALITDPTYVETVAQLSGSTAIQSISLDVDNDSGALRVYWADSNNGVQYVDIDGEESFASTDPGDSDTFTYTNSDVVTLWDGSDKVFDIVINSETNDLYFTTSGNDIIYIAGGTGAPLTIVDFPNSSKFNGVTFDFDNDMMYWADGSELWKCSLSAAISGAPFGQGETTEILRYITSICLKVHTIKLEEHAQHQVNKMLLLFVDLFSDSSNKIAKN